MIALQLGLVEITRRSFHISSGQWQVGLVSGLVVLVCVLLHYEMMSLSSRLLPHIRLPRRARIVVLILAILVTHVIEIWIFGLTYWWLDAWPHLGDLQGNLDEGALDFVYFSVTSYTTIGFGDIVPTGAIRILCGTEALVGLSMITWSASLAFLEMQRDWQEFRRLQAPRSRRSNDTPTSPPKP